MTTTPEEVQPDPEVVPSGDPGGPGGPSADPDVNPPEDPLPEGTL